MAYVGPPPGTVFQFAGSSAPAGYLLCDGSSQLRATYADLFAAIGTTYGSVDGTHFTLPDGRGRGLVGLGTHADVSTLGNNEGVSVSSRRPRHKHNHTLAISGGSHAHPNSGATDGFVSGGGFGSGSSGSTVTPIVVGANTHTHPNGEFSGAIGPNTGAEPTDSQAYLVVNHIIKF